MAACVFFQFLDPLFLKICYPVMQKPLDKQRGGMSQVKKNPIASNRRTFLNSLLAIQFVLRFMDLWMDGQ